MKKGRSASWTSGVPSRKASATTAEACWTSASASPSRPAAICADGIASISFHRNFTSRWRVARWIARSCSSSRTAGPALRRCVIRPGTRTGRGGSRQSSRRRRQASFGERQGAASRAPGAPASSSIGDALLLQRVAVAHRDGAVLERLVVDGHAPRRADLVLAAVALADRAALVVLGLHVRCAARRAISRADLGLAVLAHERQHGRLDRRQARVQLEHGARLALDLLLVVGVDEEGERRAVGAGGRLDDVRDVALARLLVEVLELLARVLGVLGQVEVAAVGDALELRPADREQVLDVGGARRVVAELVGLVLAQAQVVGADAELDVPVEARLLPVARTSAAPRRAARRTPSPSARTRACGR